MGRCLLKQGCIRKEFWPYAVMAAAYISNRCYSKRLQKTPYHAMTGRKPNLSNMRTFGSECFAYKEKRSNWMIDVQKESFWDMIRAVLLTLFLSLRLTKL